MNNFIEIQNLYFNRNTRPIFEGVNIVVPRGKVTAIMGPSGTGKTTLLRLIGGQLMPNKGEVKVAGHLLHTLSRIELYALRKRMGMLFQNGGLFTHLTQFVFCSPSLLAERGLGGEVNQLPDNRNRILSEDSILAQNGRIFNFRLGNQ